MSSLVAPQKLGFSGHETFAFRYGWLRKAVLGTKNNPKYFADPMALVDLGVGKNMVQSIRFWGLATGMLAETGRAEVEGTALGRRLLTDWDPYLEEAGSLWLLHWQLVNNPSRAAAWHHAFFAYPRRDFARGDLLEHLTDWAERQGARHKGSTLGRDVDCLLRCYTPGKRSKSGAVEESFDCPLTELGLIQPQEGGERHSFVFGAKRSLPTAVFAYALAEFLERALQGRQTVALHDVLYGPGSPGQAFKLSENALIEAVEAVEELTKGAIAMDDTAGLKQLYLRSDLDRHALLETFYRGHA